MKILKGGDQLEDLGMKDDIKSGLKEIGCEGVKWVHLVQDRFQWPIIL
jgi:hypothetical protein